MNHKERFYLILGTIVLLGFLGISIFWFLQARDKEEPARKHNKASQQETSDSITDDELKEDDREEEKKQAKEEKQADREVQRDEQKWTDEQQSLEDYIAETKPVYEGVTAEITKHFFADQELFWHELGLYIAGNYGEESIEIITFVRLEQKGTVVNCVLKVTDIYGDTLNLLGVYNKSGQYYEFFPTPDLSYDDMEDVAEGGL